MVLRFSSRRADYYSKGRNKASLQNIQDLVAPVAKNSNSTLACCAFDLGTNNTFDGCTFNNNTQEGNAIQNVSKTAQGILEESLHKTEEPRTHVLLRFAQISPEEKSKSDKGIIEAFLPQVKRKLLMDEDIKRHFMDADENLFKHLYDVDATAMYQEGAIVAYRITKVHERFNPDEA